MTAREYAELQNPEWQARGFDYIDPTKDIAADVAKLQNRLSTPSEILAQRGVDYVDYLKRWDQDKKLAASYGIDIETIYTAQAPQATAPPDPNAEPPDTAEADPAKRELLLNGHAKIFG